MKNIIGDKLSEQIANYLANKIIEFEFPPGKRLLENEIASEFGVSRSPVREAVFILEKKGLVEIIPRCGAKVTSFSKNYVKGLGDVLCQLFELIVRD